MPDEPYEGGYQGDADDEDGDPEAPLFPNAEESSRHKHEAAKGGAPMTPEVASRVVKLFREHRPPDRSYELSPHELRLLKLLMEGHNYKTAAADLGVTTHTISFHLQRIYEKLHVHSKTEAVAKALRDRLLK